MRSETVLAASASLILSGCVDGCVEEGVVWEPFCPGEEELHPSLLFPVLGVLFVQPPVPGVCVVGAGVQSELVFVFWVGVGVQELSAGCVEGAGPAPVGVVDVGPG